MRVEEETSRLNEIYRRQLLSCGLNCLENFQLKSKDFYHVFECVLEYKFVYKNLYCITINPQFEH